jgi:hypothetical protein
MKKFVSIFILFSIALFKSNVFAQVSIGSLTPPDQSAVLQVISPNSDKGVLVPELTKNQRDAITNPAHGLVIFNTDENCFNFYNAHSAEWNSLCGGISNAVGTVDCQSAVLNGTLLQGTPANSGNFLTVPVTVTKAGIYYAITATPEPANGYYFTSSGSFPEPGTYYVNLLANGIPNNASDGDNIVLTFNGSSADCSGFKVPVSAAAPDYTISNVTVVPAMFPVNSPLSPDDHYLSVTLNVKNPGQWVLVSNTVNGYSFGAQGNISQASGYNPSGSFPQTVTVIVPVTGGEAKDFGNGTDQFILTNSGSTTPSSYPVNVPLAAVGFNVSCGEATISGDPLKQNVNLTNQSISLPVSVVTTGTTTIYATGAGMKFTSGVQNLSTKGDQMINLTPETTSGPTTSGEQLLKITSEKGGVLSTCNVSVTIQPATATIEAMSVVSIMPNTGNYIVDVNGDQPTSITLSVTSSTAGEYNLTSSMENGVTYQASGTLIASALPQTVVLSPSGAPSDVVGKKNYSLTSNGKTINFDINYVYRAMKVLAIGAANYNLSTIKDHINTSATSGNNNFGASGKVPTAGVTLTSMTATAAGTMATNLNSNYDIVIVGYNNNTWDENDITAAVNFVNSNGVLFLATENYSNATTGSTGNTVENILAQLFEVSAVSYDNNTSSLWYTSATNQGMYIAVDNSDPILDGAFGNITGKYLGDDYANTSSVLAGTLPPTAVALASPLSGTSPHINTTPSTSWFAVRHKDLGFVWVGDGGFCGAYHDRQGAVGTTSPVNDASPLNTQGWTGTSATGAGITGVQQVYNGPFIMNFLGYAIKYAGTHKRQ